MLAIALAGAQHEAAEAARHHRRVVVAAHQARHHEQAQNAAISATCAARITSSGITRPASSHSRSVISAITRNSDSATVPMSSMARCDRPNAPGDRRDCEDRGDQHGADVGGQCQAARP